MRPLLVLSIAGLLVTASAASWSQQAAPDQKPAKKAGKTRAGAKRAAKPAIAQAPAAEAAQDNAQAGAEAQAKAPKYQPLDISAGWAEWNLRGQEHKFRQYATPPKGAFLDELRYLPWYGDASKYGKLTLKGLGGDDFWNDAQLSFFHGSTMLAGALTQHHFFDASPFALPNDDREIQDISLKQHVTRDLSLGLQYRMDQQNTYFENPALPLHQRTRTTDAILTGKLGPGSVSLSVTDWHFFDRTTTRPDASVQRYEAGYQWTPNANLAVAGSYTRHDIKQSGEARSHIDLFAVDGFVGIGADTDLDLNYFNETLHLPVVQNAFDRARRGGGGRIVHHWPGWTLQLGIREKEAERVRGDQSFVDVPKWVTFDGRLSGRLSRQTRVSLSGSHQDLSDPPVMTTDDDRALFWKHKDSVQAKIETGTGLANGYVVGTWKQLDNGDRSVTLTTTSVTLGGNWQVKPRLSAFAEYQFEGWNGQSEIADFPDLNNFSPNTRDASAGFSWLMDDRTSLWASVNDVATSNDNPLRLRNGNTSGQYFTISLRHQLRSGYALGLIVSPWRYRDRVDNLMNYDTSDVMVTASGKF